MSQLIARKTYHRVFAALMVLLVLSVWTARFDLGSWNLAIALGISLAKTLLVVTYFMHLLYSTALVRLMAVGSLLWLAFLLVLTFSDYTTRGWRTDAERLVFPATVDRAEVNP